MAKKKQQETVQPEGEAPAGKKSLFKNKKLLLILGAFLIVIVAAGAGIYLFLGSSGGEDREVSVTEAHSPEGDAGKAEEKEGGTEAHGEKTEGQGEEKQAPNVFEQIYVMPPMEISLKDENRTLMVSIRLELDRPELAVEFNDRKDMIHGAIRSILAAKTMAELEGAEAKIRLKMALVTELNRRLETGKIRNIYFTDYLII